VLIVLTSPPIRCGRGSPPLPIAIQCLNLVEGQALYKVIKPVVSALLATPTPTKLLEVFAGTDAVRNFFPPTMTEFYAVVVGSPPGVHRSR
jgi:hypothetical protein